VGEDGMRKRGARLVGAPHTASTQRTRVFISFWCLTQRNATQRNARTEQQHTWPSGTAECVISQQSWLVLQPPHPAPAPPRRHGVALIRARHAEGPRSVEQCT
jgi:hypothetical protein